MHANTLVITIYNIFLRDLFVNFDRYYYKHATTLFALNRCLVFSADLRVLQLILSHMDIIYACKQIRYNLFIIFF